MDNEIKPAGTFVRSEASRKQAREYYQRKKAEKKAAKLATGEFLPKPESYEDQVKKIGRPKSVVNRATEYGALFNVLNQQRIDNGLPPLKTAMETLIEALQSEELDIKDRARIAERIANFESSRAPTISIEHVQNVISSEETVTSDEALNEFMDSLRKV
jgi:phosphopantetheine adenylyltransferase